MKTKSLSIIASFALVMLFSFSTAIAQKATPKVTKTQVNQQKRIKQGVKNGELTKAEFIALEKQQRRVNRNKRRAKADGKVTPAERARIRAHQKASSANIARKKHNKIKR